MDKQNNNNSSNENNHHQHPPDDPLRQLNQFQQTNQPAQPGQNNLKQPPSKPNGQNEKNQFQEQLSIWLNQLKNWWGEFSQKPFIEKLKEHQKWVWVVGGVLAACLLIWIVVSASGDESDVINEFEMALLDGDKEKLKDLVESEDSDLEVDDAYLTKLIQFSSENERFLPSVLAFLKAQKSLYEEKEDEIISHFGELDERFGENLNKEFNKNEQKAKKEIRKLLLGDYLKIYLKKNNFLYSLFGPDYVIGLRPSYFKVSLTNGPTQLKIDNKPVELKKGAKEQKIGPFLPGNYKLKAIKKYPFAEVVDEREVVLYMNENSTEPVEFVFIGDKATFQSDIEGTELFINNQSTKTKVGKDGKEFGPVQTDGKLKAYGQFKFPWGTLKSNPVPISNDKIDITPNPFSDNQVKTEVIKRINDYAKEKVEVQKKKDGTLFTSLDEEQKKKWINDMADKREYSSDHVYKGEAIKTVIAVKKAIITESDDADTYKIKVPVQFHWREREYTSFDNGDEPLEEKVEELYTWLTYNNQEKRWEISEFSPLFFGDDLFKDSSVVTTNF